MAKEPTRFFGLVNFNKHQNFRGKRAHWMKLSLDFFDDPVIVGLPDSQRLAFIGVLILCAKRSNRVPFDPTYIKKRCSLRVTPDLDLFLSQGLIAITQAESGAELFPRGEERREEEEKRTPPPPANDAGATETRPAFGVLLDEAACPACKNRGTIRRASGGRGYFCGDKLGGCGQTYDLLEPSILNQLTPRARKAIEDRVDAQAAAMPRAPPPPPPDPAIAAAEEDAWNSVPTLVDEFLAWYAENPEAGETFGRRGYHGQAFGGWPRGRDLPPGPKDAVLKGALKKLKAAPEGARRVG